MRLPARPAPRAGLSLLEVLAALSIFLMSFVAIGKLVTVATEHSLEVQMQSQATQMAQSKLNEVVAGALPLSSQTGNFDEDPDWQWSIDAEEQGDVSGLWTVKVRVWRQLDNRDVESTLAQMVLDPSNRGSMFDQVTVTGSTDTASSSSNSNSSNSSSAAAQQPAQSAGVGSMAGGAGGKGGVSGMVGGGGGVGGKGGGGVSGMVGGGGGVGGKGGGGGVSGMVGGGGGASGMVGGGGASGMVGGGGGVGGKGGGGGAGGKSGG